MRAVVLASAGVVELATLPDPSPGDDQVVVEVAAVGLCGTDLQIADGVHGHLPLVPGHELSGTVVAAGRAVTRVHVGDRVAVDPNLPCRSCRSCHAGRRNLCPDLGALGVTTAGAAAELVAAPATACVHLPDELDLVSAALVEPLSCAVRAFDVLRSELGARVLVYGAGTMGLMLLQLAQRTGATCVDVVERNADKRQVAVTLGASAAAASTDELDGEAWDVVVDATGSAEAITDGLGHVAPGGTFLQFGVTSPDARVPLSPYDVYRREITITGSMAVLNSFARAVDLLAAGFVSPDVLITRRARLEEYEQALASFRRGEGLKTLVLPGA